MNRGEELLGAAAGARAAPRRRALYPKLNTPYRAKLWASYACATLVLVLGLATILHARGAEGSLSGFGWIMGLGNVVAFALAMAVTSWIGKAFSDLHAANLELEARAEQLAKHDRAAAEQLAVQRRLAASLAEANAALLRSNADLEQFAYIASHDLRAPLRGVANLADWLEDDLGPAVTPPIKKHLDTMRGRVRRLEALLVGIVAYSRAGRETFATEPVDVGRLIRGVVDLLALPPATRFTLGTPMPVIVAPRAPLQQIFLNLLSNAAKHGTPGGGDVEVRAEETADFWSFSVSDRGPGVPVAYRDTIFALFRTLAPRDRVEGSGIGLSVVKKLVERYGGAVRVDDRAGGGATFTFTWPKSAGK